MIEDLGEALKEVKASPQGSGGDMVALYGESRIVDSQVANMSEVGLKNASSLISTKLN